MSGLDRSSLVGMAIKRAQALDYKAPHEVLQDISTFKQYGVAVSADTLAKMNELLPKLEAEQAKTRLVAKRRQAAVRAIRATKRGPKIKKSRDEDKKGSRGR